MSVRAIYSAPVRSNETGSSEPSPPASVVGEVYDEHGGLLGHLDVVVRDASSAFVWPARSSSLLDPIPRWEDKYIEHRIERHDGRWTCPPGSIVALAARRQWTAA